MSEYGFNEGCTGKVPYFSEAEARSHNKNFKASRGNTKVYHCKFLIHGQEHWHITSMGQNVYRKFKHKARLQQTKHKVILDISNLRR